MVMVVPEAIGLYSTLPLVHREISQINGTSQMPKLEMLPAFVVQPEVEMPLFTCLLVPAGQETSVQLTKLGPDFVAFSLASVQ